MKLVFICFKRLVMEIWDCFLLIKFFRVCDIWVILLVIWDVIEFFFLEDLLIFVNVLDCGFRGFLFFFCVIVLFFFFLVVFVVDFMVVWMNVFWMVLLRVLLVLLSLLDVGFFFCLLSFDFWIFKIYELNFVVVRWCVNDVCREKLLYKWVGIL